MADTTTKSSTLNVSTYDVSNIVFGKELKNAEYGFSKFKLTYPREDVNSDDNIIKMTNVKVLGVYTPAEDHKNPKYTVLFAVDNDNEECVKFCETFDKHIIDTAFEKRTTLFDDGEEYDMEDLEANYKPVFSERNGSYSFSVSFPFNNPDVKNPIRIAYKQSEMDSEVIQSTDLVKKLGKGSICDVFLHFTNIYRDNTDKFKVQSTIYKRINVLDYQNLESLGGGAGGGFRPAQSIEEIDEKDIVMGKVITNDRQGRSLKPRLRINGDDSKTRAITVTIKGKVRFVRMNDANTGKTNFSVVYNPTDEEVEHFERLNDYMKSDLFSNYSKYEKGKITKKNLDKQFRGTISQDKEGRKTMWFTVYAREQEDGTFDFGGNFIKSDETSRYTNDEVLNNVFGEEYDVTMNIYFKHIWFGKFYSCKFNMGSVMLDIKNVEYDLGDDTYYDGEASEQQTSGDQDNDLDQDEETTNTTNQPENSDTETEDSEDSDDGDDSD